MVWYPSIEKIIEFNVLSLSVVKAKRADAAKVLSRAKISVTIASCMEAEGGVFVKAAVLLKGLVQAHAFASGNRRTAFLVTKYFLVRNNQRLGVADNPENAKVLLGVRENHYSVAEIKEWIEHGKIKEFKR
ncbi:MAG TPA: type II toxin-antitoxin system death-on-curing family toxin [Candidatus Diapherotrites archaeon]|uniref:Type II toxin-antitoxin system death-on-curing family toxin n=1 Tax=Candidatus Iainarchaeum sp. TaxID=3101447 RepID=A0A7J4JJL2_9ARCH|nr:type II toxin-antitoxin system death-on-curing family toxin [Candidatus Diapherotrites archaeon]HIH17040.1 type II toxin-antitoxin system death-on-curing family toxin [Candidatus Diapherotrites archaeon]